MQKMKHQQTGRSRSTMVRIIAFLACCGNLHASYASVGLSESPKGNGESPAVSSAKAETSPFDAIPPFSPEEFWLKLQHLIKSHDGFVTAEEFERAFGIKLSHTSDFGELGSLSYVSAHTEWYFHAELSTYKKAFIQPPNIGFANPDGFDSRLEIVWPTAVPPSLSPSSYVEWNSKECLRPLRVIDDLAQLGWQRSKSPESCTDLCAPNVVYLSIPRKNARVSINYSDSQTRHSAGEASNPNSSCLFEISISGSK